MEDYAPMAGGSKYQPKVAVKVPTKSKPSKAPQFDFEASAGDTTQNHGDTFTLQVGSDSEVDSKASSSVKQSNEQHF